MVRINTKTSEIIKELTFEGQKGEEELQNLVEKHLPQLLKAFVIKSKQRIPNGEIDTLAISEDGVPCIIEYKRSKDETILNQIVYYYDWLLKEQAKYEFEKLKDAIPNLQGLEVDWSEIRLIIIAKSFSKWDESLIRHLDTDIEAYAYSYHENELDLHRERFGVSERRTSTSIQRDTYEKHLEKAEGHTKEILEELRKQVLSLGDDIEEGYTPNYIKYVVKTIFLSVHVYRKHLICHLRVNEETFSDPKNLTKDISDRKWSVTREFKIEEMDEIPYVIELIKQAYEYQ